MKKEEIINFWINSSQLDWDAVSSLFKAGNYMHSLFFAHLSIEKLLKAHWVKDNDEDYPPRVHNLEYLYNQTKLSLDVQYIDELRIITSWNIEGRYQYYRDQFYKLSTKQYTERKLEIVNKIRECLPEKLP